MYKYERTALLNLYLIYSLILNFAILIFQLFVFVFLSCNVQCTFDNFAVYEIRDKCWEVGIAGHCARIVQKCAEFRGITVLVLMAHK